MTKRKSLFNDYIKPTAEMDIAVAIKVMGWSRKKKFTSDWLEPKSNLWVPLHQVKLALHGMPEFSTNIAAAFHLVDAVLQTSDFVYFILEYDSATWSAKFSNDEYYVIGFGESAALAICQASLNAMEYKVTE